MFGREPVAIVAAIAAILQGVGIFYLNDITFTTVGWEAWLLPVVTLIAGFIGRSQVVPVKTVEDAGETSNSLKARARVANRAG